MKWPNSLNPWTCSGTIPFSPWRTQTFGRDKGSECEEGCQAHSSLAAGSCGWHRIKNGLEPLPLDDHLSHAAHFLWQLNGTKPEEEMAHDLIPALSSTQTTHSMLHLCCREVVSTRAHMYAGLLRAQAPFPGVYMAAPMRGDEDARGAGVERDIPAG